MQCKANGLPRELIYISVQCGGPGMSFLLAKFLHDFADTFSAFHYLEGTPKFFLNNLF
jgi:hypothetical protein